MKPELSDPLSEAHDILQQASNQMDSILKQSDSLFLQYTSLIEIVDKILDYTDKLEIERNTWRFRAEELEKDRNEAWREIIKLRERISEPCCPECGWPEPMVVRGGDESWVECPQCGTKDGLR